jgi:peptide/nickel transport system substrate-binding protein
MDDGAPLFTTAAAPGGHRGGTLRIAAGSDQQAGPPDPSVTDESLLLPLTNDALLTYRQVGGSDAVDLVPDLATTIPGSSDGGSTWTFRLRSGITYSDGTPLAASDVRRSAERAIAAGRVTGVTTTVEGISGAAECTPDRCDLRRGIEVDDAAGTVTFHLSQPDPRFLDALPFLFIVPGRTPLAVSQTPLPATGPYAFDTVAPDHVVLRRNPMFRVWSADAQPDGYPDEIDWQTYDDPVAVVASGAADVLSATLDGQTLQQLETTNASQLVISPSMQTWFEMMNTKVAPFDDPSVRQAVNLAVDRAEVARLYGAGKVTCQVVQPGFAGYEPYCPYTIAPDGSGTWRGPDPRAKDMIPPRYRGMRVTVEGADIPGHADVARYFAGLLDALGFKADLKLSDVPTFFGGEGPLAGPSDAQMAGYWFLIGSPAASSMIPGAFTCPDYRDAPVVPGNYPQDFCDRALDARITHALRSEASVDPAERAAAEAEWAAIDRAIVDAAPAVIPFNVQNVDFVSRRVGNIQHHRVQGLLLDQLWLDGPG